MNIPIKTKKQLGINLTARDFYKAELHVGPARNARCHAVESLPACDEADENQKWPAWMWTWHEQYITIH